MPAKTVARTRRSIGVRVGVRTGHVADRVRAAAGRRRRHALVLGDSHAGVFRHPSWREIPMRLDIVAVPSATLTGMRNPESAAHTRTHFDKALTNAVASRRLPVAVVSLIGEVDCGFILWRRHERLGTPLAELVDQAVANYRMFVLEALQVAPVAVVSVPLPTLVDGSTIGDYAGQRREITASRAERTALALQLNERCKAMAVDTGATFVDLDHASLGPDGEVSDLLVGLDPRDHHYDPIVYARLLQRALAPVLGYQLKAGPLPPAEGGQS